MKLAQRDVDGALADLDEALRLDQSYAETFVRRGQALLAKHEPDRALSDFDQALRRDVINQTFYSGAGIAYSGRPRNTDRTSNDARAQLGRALAFLQKTDQQAALGALGEAIRIDPRSPALYATRATVLAQRGDHDGAIADYNLLLQLNPRDPGAYRSRGCAWAAKGNFDNALRDIDAALRVDPANESALAARGLLVAGQTCKL